MDWIDRFRMALAYIEENIDSILNFDEIASQANTTSFHFQRTFSILAGITLGEYIRRRRLTIAAQALATTDTRILDVAMQYGYETQASFTKAFTKLHGFPPGAIRGNEQQIKAFPPLTLKFVIEGDESMDYVLKKLPPLRLVGKTITVTTKNDENFEIIPRFWKEIMSDGTFAKICTFYDSKGQLVESSIGACLDFSQDQEQFVYMAAVESSKEEIPEGLSERLIPSMNWAIFEGSGTLPDSLQTLMNRIYNEWFPATGFEHTGGPELELYLPPEKKGTQCTHFKIMIPVQKKEV